MSSRTEEAFDCKMSNTQERHTTHMIDKLFDNAGFRCMGERRHDAKNEAMANGASGTHEIMKNTGVYSYETMDKLKGQFHIFVNYCKINYGVKTIDSIKTGFIKDFLNEMADRGYSQKTFESYCSTLERFAVAQDKAYDIQGTSKSEQWHNVIQECKAELNGQFAELNHEARAYDNPQAVIDNLKTDACWLVGSLQLNHGLRLSDACKLEEIATKGEIVHSKGGQAIHGVLDSLTPKEKAVLSSLAADDYKGLRNRYQYELKAAASEAGEQYSGKATHGLRHNYAQNQYNGYLEQGYSPRQALLSTAEDMGHHRPEITQEYLR